MKTPVWLIYGTVLVALAAGTGTAVAQPYGLDLRQDVAAYLSMPQTDSGAPPALLSQTGAFSDTANLVTVPGLIPYRINSALWSDGAIKTRWIGLPYAAASGSNPQITFAPTGDWAFPDGTVLVKHFEVVVDERNDARKRMETRVLVRKQGGYVYGRSYKWRADNTDADRLDNALSEAYDVILENGSTETRQWFFPGPDANNGCLRCHTPATGGVLGPKTHQMNGDFTYASTGITDNQLRTWGHLGMLSATFNEANIPTYGKSVAVTDTSATLEHRSRSYLDANCSHCHRPGEIGLYDARFDTPLLDQGIIGNKLERFNNNSRIIVRDNATSNSGGMPPIAKNVVDDFWIDTVKEWVNYAFDVVSVSAFADTTKVRVTFDRALDPATATNPGNYAVSNGVTVSAAVLGADPRVVTLTTSPLSAGPSYTITLNRVREAAAPGNPVWPQTQRTFTYSVLDPAADQDQDSIPNGVEAGEGLSPYVKDNDIFTVARLFAMQQYRDFLGREGDSTGVQNWTGQITGGLQTREQVIESFFDSQEFQSGMPQVTRLYFAFFNRIPDYPGLMFHAGRYRVGVPLNTIAQDFAGSQEFLLTYGSLDNGQYVDLVYQNVLGRPADPDGRANALAQLDGGAMTRGELMVAFSESAENIQRRASHVFVTAAYVGMLRRSPDEPGLQNWVNAFASGMTRTQMLGAFMVSQEYHNRFLP